MDLAHAYIGDEVLHENPVLAVLLAAVEELGHLLEGAELVLALLWEGEGRVGGILQPGQETTTFLISQPNYLTS